MALEGLWLAAGGGGGGLYGAPEGENLSKSRYFG